MIGESGRRVRDHVRMNPSEWLEIAATIRERYPAATLPPETLQRWGEDLADLPAEHVGAGVEALTREGREFPPHSGQIRAKAVALAVDAPEWAEVLRVLRADDFEPPDYCERCNHSGWLLDATDTAHACECLTVRREAAAAYKRARHPLIRAFIEAVGRDQIESGLDGGNGEARLREKWLAFCRAVHRDALYRGIPPAGLRALERVNSEPRRLGAGVRQVTRQLERGRAA